MLRGKAPNVEPVLIVAVVLLFASSVIVDGIVQAFSQAWRPALRLVDTWRSRPPLAPTYGPAKLTYR